MKSLVNINRVPPIPSKMRGQNQNVLQEISYIIYLQTKAFWFCKPPKSDVDAHAYE